MKAPHEVWATTHNGGYVEAYIAPVYPCTPRYLLASLKCGECAIRGDVVKCHHTVEWYDAGGDVIKLMPTKDDPACMEIVPREEA